MTLFTGDLFGYNGLMNYSLILVFIFVGFVQSLLPFFIIRVPRLQAKFKCKYMLKSILIFVLYRCGKSKSHNVPPCIHL